MMQIPVFSSRSGAQPIMLTLLTSIAGYTLVGIIAGSILLRNVGFETLDLYAWSVAYALAMIAHSWLAGHMLFREGTDFGPGDAGKGSTGPSVAGRTVGPSGGENRYTGIRSLGPGNQITLIRGGLNSACVAFAFVPAGSSWQFAPFILYALSIVLDFFDGFVARKTGTTSKFGEALEQEFDSIGVIAASAVAWSWGALSLPYLLASPVRTYFVAGAYLRVRAGKPMYPLTPTISARVIAGLYMGFLCVALVPVFPSTLLSAGAPLFLIALLAGLGRDWLVSTGRIDISGRWYRSMQTRFNAIMLGWLPVVLRFAAAGLMAVVATDLETAPAFFFYALSILLIAGIAGRIAALAAIATFALYVYPPELTGAIPVAAFVLSVLILILGTGHYSVAKPEEYPFARRI